MQNLQHVLFSTSRNWLHALTKAEKSGRRVTNPVAFRVKKMLSQSPLLNNVFPYAYKEHFTGFGLASRTVIENLAYMYLFRINKRVFLLTWISSLRWQLPTSPVGTLLADQGQNVGTSSPPDCLGLGSLCCC